MSGVTSRPPPSAFGLVENAAPTALTALARLQASRCPLGSAPLRRQPEQRLPNSVEAFERINVRREERNWMQRHVLRKASSQHLDLLGVAIGQHVAFMASASPFTVLFKAS